MLPLRRKKVSLLLNNNLIEVHDDEKQQEKIEKFYNYKPSIKDISLLAATSEIKHFLQQEEKFYKLNYIFPPNNELSLMVFDDKVMIFKELLQKLKIDWRKGSENININREEIITQSMTQFKSINPYKELKINFIGEVNQDAGGLIREWLTVLFQELLSEKMKLFEKADTNEFSLKIYQNIDYYSEKNREIFNFIGKILAKSLLENLTINTCFNKYIYKVILDEPVDFSDYIFINQTDYHSLEKMKKIENLSDLSVTFSVQYKNENNELITEDLITNGREIEVTKDNLDFYIKSKIKYYLNKDKILINEIKKGLISLIPENLIKILKSDELELILNGTPFIDLEDWKTHTIYNGYYTTDQIIKDFWNIMSEMTQENLVKILQFCTGSKRVPIGGFKSLESNRGNTSLFCLTKVDYESNKINYIRAHTCFNRLDIPNFPTKQLLQEAIDFIITNEILGFGIE